MNLSNKIAFFLKENTCDFFFINYKIKSLKNN
ncbi:MAG: hypothetical protein ACI9JY_001586, partial [Saprospiraceae bacterium]